MNSSIMEISDNIKIHIITEDKSGILFEDFTINIESIIEAFFNEDIVYEITKSYFDKLKTMSRRPIEEVGMKRKIKEYYQQLFSSEDIPDTLLKGNLGESVMHSLAKYLGYQLIIPKYKFITNPKSAVNGIDAVFQKDESVIFTEVKYNGDFGSGIRKLNGDLKQHDTQKIESAITTVANFDEILKNEMVKKIIEIKSMDPTKEYYDVIKESGMKVDFLGFLVYEEDISKYSIALAKDMIKNSNLVNNDIYSKKQLICMPISTYEKIISILKGYSNSQK